MKLKIDDAEVDIVRQERCPDGSGWKRLFIKPAGAEGGPRSQHDVPYTTGKFRTNGHTYEFTE